jgi:hypothetical protein
MLQILQQTLPDFSDDFRQEINENLSKDGRVYVRAMPKNKYEVKQWLEEFARVAGISYICVKSFPNADRKSYREEFICHHSDTSKRVKSSNNRLVEHNHKATGCLQRLYVSIRQATIGVIKGESKKGIHKKFVKFLLVIRRKQSTH